MAEDLEKSVWDALKAIKFPGMSRDIVSFGFVQQVKVAAGGTVAVDLQIATQKERETERVKADIEHAVRALPGVRQVTVNLHTTRPANPQESAQRAISQDAGLIPEVRHVVAVASGKGGVGKSTVAANLAVALGQLGYRVGILDSDIYGPSVPMMFGIHEKPIVEANRILPFEKYGIKIMSLGFILETDTPVIWRGPMVMRAIEQMLGDVVWGALDYLVLDLPPGTGDAQLTVTQKVPLAGAVIVTTPQDVALIDARKGLAMFKKVNVPVLGIIENMSSFVCPHCGAGDRHLQARRRRAHRGSPRSPLPGSDPARRRDRPRRRRRSADRRRPARRRALGGLQEAGGSGGRRGAADERGEAEAVDCVEEDHAHP